MKKAIIALILCLVPISVVASDWGSNTNLAPDPNYSRTYVIGTKGMANYSTAGRRAIYFLAANSTGTPITVKTFLNGSETNVMNLSTGTFHVRNYEKIGFRAYSTATSVTVTVWGE